MHIKDSLAIKVLHTLNTNAQLSAGVVAKRLKVHSHRVSYAERMLRERYGLTTIPYINYGRLGVVSYLIFFSLRAQERKNRVLEAILSHRRVGWLGELAGAYEYGCAFLATDVRQVGEFFESICNRFGEIFTSRQIVPRLTFEWFGRRYLAPSAAHGKSLRYTALDESVAIDPVDIQLLAAIGTPGVRSVQDAAKKAGIPYPTAVRRVRALEEGGVIAGYFASINPELLQRGAYRILIQTGTSSRKAADLMRSIAQKDPRATYFVECLGPWEFEIGWELHNARELTEITGRIGSSFPQQAVRMQVLNELRDIKWSFFPSQEVVVREG